MPTPKNSGAKRGRGRPPHQTTAATRAKVSIAAGSGAMTHQEIAIALGISRETLEKYYEHELSIGALTKRLEVLQGLHAAAKKGSSSAARVYLEHSAKTGVPPPGVGEPTSTPVQPTASPPAADPSVTPAPKLGKKEQAQADAKTAHVGTAWDELLNPPRMPVQ